MARKQCFKKIFLATKIYRKKIIRITSDCPLIDTNIIKSLIKKDIKKIMITANNHPRTFPHGYDLKYLKSLLKKAYLEAYKKVI